MALRNKLLIVRHDCGMRGIQSHMKVVAFVSQKGGAGKTPLAASCGVQASQCGLRVCMMERDKQGSHTACREARKKLGRDEPEFRLIDTAAKLKTALVALRTQFDLVIIDTKGEDSAFTSSAIA